MHSPFEAKCFFAGCSNLLGKISYVSPASSTNRGKKKTSRTVLWTRIRLPARHGENNATPNLLKKIKNYKKLFVF